MLPEIDTVAKTPDERILLIELAKSANTRNLIGTVLTRECDVVARVESMAQSHLTSRCRSDSSKHSSASRGRGEPGDEVPVYSDCTLHPLLCSALFSRLKQELRPEWVRSPSVACRVRLWFSLETIRSLGVRTMMRAIPSDTTDEIACWFIDTDCNEESLFVRHA